MSSSSIWPIDRTLSGATTSGQSRPGSDDNEEVLCILQSTSIIGASPSDCFVLYPGHSLRKTYTSVEMQSMYSAPQGFRQIVSKEKNTRCSLACRDFQKELEKIILERKKESMRSVPDWSVSDRIAWRGHWFARGNRSVTATVPWTSIMYKGYKMEKKITWKGR